MPHKTNNIHKAHPTECDRCGRQLPKKAYRPICSSCRKQAAFQTRLFAALVSAGAQERKVA